MFLTTALTLGAIFFGGFSHRNVLNQAYRLGTWQFRVQRDGFTGAVRCRLFRGRAKAPDVAYARHTLAFRFGARLDTLEAAYRIDSGPTIMWGSEYPELVQLGAAPTAGTMDNPTGGLVMLPVSVLSGAHRVEIRPTPRSQVRTFDVDGWADALAHSRSLGCAADSDFIR